MNDARCTVLTIGHSTHALDAFIVLLQRHHVTAVADVRSAPYSRFNPQFNREPFAKALKAQGIRYVYLGRELGGRSDDPDCYEDGRVRYERIAATESFRSGLDRVVRGADKHRIALMCAEKEPLDCHRTLLVGRALHQRGVDVAHIHAARELEPHAKAMDRLLNMQKQPRGDDLFKTREELLDDAIAQQTQRIAYVDDKQAAGTEEQAS